MTSLKKVLGLALIVVVSTALAAYMLRPSATPNTGSVVVNEPDNPEPDQGGDDDTTPGADDPPLPERLSNGPNHPVCLKPNEHIPDHAQQRGANWYRFFGNPGCASPSSRE